MTVARRYYELGICPSPGKQEGKDGRTPVALSQEYDEETNRLTVNVYMLRRGWNPPDKIYDMYLCQQMRQCGCSYNASVGWEINETLCTADVYWTWPSEAGCMLKSGSLAGSVSGSHYTEALAEAPGNAIYSVGDIRNPECPGCGMSNVDRETEIENPVPGEAITLSGCIDEESCLSLYGAGGCHPIGHERFETVGFMGGRVAVTSDTYSTTSTWIQSILDANAEKNFVQRILYPDSYPTYQINEEEYGTHLMMYSSYSGVYVVYPTLVCNDFNNCTELILLSEEEAFNFALRQGEYISFTNEDDAELFSTSYKVVWLASEWFDEDGNFFPDAYLVDIDGEPVPCWSTDPTGYEVGDWVALAKVGTEFPLDDFDNRVAVTNNNVPTVEEYIIIPFQFAGAA